MDKILEDQGKVKPEHLVLKDLPSSSDEEPSPEKLQIKKNRQIASEKFYKKLMILGTTREFKNRNPNFFKHEYSDKLVIMDKVERTLHKKIDAKMFLGDNGSGKNAYMTAIQPIAAVKKAQHESLRQVRSQKREGQYIPQNVR